MMKAEQAFETSLIGLLICVRLMNNVEGMNNFLFFYREKKWTLGDQRRWLNKICFIVS